MGTVTSTKQKGSVTFKGGALTRPSRRWARKGERLRRLPDPAAVALGRREERTRRTRCGQPRSAHRDPQNGAPRAASSIAADSQLDQAGGALGFRCVRLERRPASCACASLMNAASP